VERDRRDYEREDKDAEHDSRDLDIGQRKRKPFPRKMEDTAGAESHQGGANETHGINSVSASSYDDKDALKSKSLRIFNYCMLFLFCGIIDALFPSSHYLSSKGAT
jgi:paired amphipathic helix protein Sin3a